MPPTCSPTSRYSIVNTVCLYKSHHLSRSQHRLRRSLLRNHRVRFDWFVPHTFSSSVISTAFLQPLPNQMRAQTSHFPSPCCSRQCATPGMRHASTAPARYVLVCAAILVSQTYNTTQIPPKMLELFFHLDRSCVTSLARSLLLRSQPLSLIQRYCEHESGLICISCSIDRLCTDVSCMSVLNSKLREAFEKQVAALEDRVQTLESLLRDERAARRAAELTIQELVLSHSNPSLLPTAITCIASRQPPQSHRLHLTSVHRTALHSSTTRD